MSIVSLSGVDGIGKSEQIALLRSHPQVRYGGPLTQYSDKWPKLSPADHFEWWFKRVPFERFLDLVIESLNERRHQVIGGFVNVQDRGERMFKAVCVATLLTRESTVGFSDATRIVDSAFKSGLAHEEGKEILLVRDERYGLNASVLNEANKLERESPFSTEQNNTYSKYQSYLSVALDHYTAGEECRKVQVDSCILSVQNELRAILSEMTATTLPALCGDLEELVVFSGLSECGKSSFAQTLHDRKGFYRLKIKYFRHLATRHNAGKDTREAIGHELVRFLDDHAHIRQVTLESLHGPELGLHLKALFGNRCKVVFISAPERLRIERLSQQLKISEADATVIVREKDALKISCGIENVIAFADVLFENSGSDFETAFESFHSVLRSKLKAG
ncbi:MAG: hypothetical protein AAB921_02810 [Patescibacteria group bacterium]